MIDLGQLAVFFLIHQNLQEPFTAYGINWEERETEELLSFVKAAKKEIQRRGKVPVIPLQTVRITRSYRIFIGQQELKVRPMAKSILLLFLRHPEGILLKRIADYEKELAFFYRKVSRSSSPDEITERIHKILDLFNNDLNVNIARVNHAITTLVDDSPNYGIKGEAGKPKRIGLDRKWVIWES